MKRCPSCQRTYADDTLKFCLQDGSTLVEEGGQSVQAYRSGAATEILDSPSLSTNQMPPTAETIAYQPRSTADASHESYSKPPAPKQNTGLVVGLTAIVTLILVALAGLGAWFYFKNDSTTRKNSPPELNQNQGDVNNQNANVKVKTSPVDSASPSPAASPTPSPIDVAAIRQQVTTVLNGWTSASRERDLDKHMSYYADTLDTYYNATNVSSSRVRSDRSRAYTAYDTLDVELSDIKVTPDPSGDVATATFDKTWTFEGSEKYSSGSVHQKVWLAKIDGRWRITGEKDLKVYYVNRER
jgi:ketosteroid isomerase-like protein